MATSEKAARNEKIVRAFCKVWEKRDVDAVLSYFTPDIIWHNVPLKPLHGLDACRGFLTPFFGAAEKIWFDINVLIPSDDHVVTERIDHFVFGPTQISLPIAGIMDMTPGGKIANWRDYFDMKTWDDQGGPPVE